VTVTDVWVLLAESLTEAGELGRAEQIWHRARQSGRETGNRHKYHIATLRKAERLSRGGHPEQARQLLTELIDTPTLISRSVTESARALLQAVEQQAANPMHADGEQ
jgi:hypothetical protein